MRNGLDLGRLLRCLALSTIVVVLVLLSSDNDLVLQAERHLDNWWYLLYSEKRAEDRVVVIEIDDETLEYYFPEIPLPRDQIALLLDELAGPLAEARTVVVDLYFEGPDRIELSNDTLLAHVINAHKEHIVCALYFPDNVSFTPEYSQVYDSLLQRFSFQLEGLDLFQASPGNLPPSVLLGAADFYGHIAVYQSETKVPHELPLFIRAGNSTIGALAIEAVRNYLGIDRSDVTFEEGRLSLGGHLIPLDEHGTMGIKYFEHTTGYTRHSFLELLGRFDNEQVTLDMFNDKIVLIGINSKQFYPKEFSYTPFGQERPNVYIHADVISNILNDSYISNVDRSVLPIAGALIGLVFCVIHMISTKTWRLIISLTLMVCIALVDFVLFQQGHVLQAVPLMLIALPMSVYTYFVSFREQTRIIESQEREALSLRKREQSLVEIEKEIRVARALQEHLLPQTIPNIDGFDLYGINLAAKGVSGDFFDYVELSNDLLAIMVADVSGKGISASLLMAASQSVLRIESQTQNANCEGIVGEANSLIHAITESSRFVTLFYAILDQRSGSLCYVNAGHNSPIYLNGNGALSYLESGGVILGAFPDAKYQSNTFSLKPEEKIIIFTDGVVEATNRDDQQYGDSRLAELVAGSKSLSSEQLAERIISNVSEFCGGVDQSDDITLVILGKNGRMLDGQSTPDT